MAISNMATTRPARNKPHPKSEKNSRAASTHESPKSPAPISVIIVIKSAKAPYMREYSHSINLPHILSEIPSQADDSAELMELPTPPIRSGIQENIVSPLSRCYIPRISQI